MRLMNGWVCIKPFKDEEKIGNIYLPIDEATKDYLNICGEVVDVPRELPYFGRECEELRSQYPDGYTRPAYAQEKLSALNNRSMNFETPIEVSKGDVVLFDWKQRAFSENANTDDEHLYMRYDALIMTKDYKMLNGWLLVEPCKEDLGELAVFEKYSEVECIVKHEGSIVSHYRETPYCVDMDMELKGKKVLVRKSRMRKIEKFYMGILDNPNYHLIQRKDILAYDPS